MRALLQMKLTTLPRQVDINPHQIDAALFATSNPQTLPMQLTTEQALHQATTHHQAGRLQDAERLYRAVLHAQPNHPDANHNLGLLAVQVKQPAFGLSYLKIALEANPNQGQYWLSYIDALIQADQADVARQVLTQGRQLPLAARLLNMLWPDEVTAVLVQQVREPEEEQRLRSTIPRLTDIEDEVSLLVQNQYEENPYPRWIKIASGDKPMAVGVALSRKFPLADFQPLGKCDISEILIAGCGTGQHTIEISQEYQGAQVLAIDLSMASVCYANQKLQDGRQIETTIEPIFDLSKITMRVFGKVKGKQIRHTKQDNSRLSTSFTEGGSILISADRGCYGGF